MQIFGLFVCSVLCGPSQDVISVLTSRSRDVVSKGLGLGLDLVLGLKIKCLSLVP